MKNPLAWLGGRSTPKDEAASADRARRHRRSIPKAAAAGERWEQADRARFSRSPSYRRR